MSSTMVTSSTQTLSRGERGQGRAGGNSASDRDMSRGSVCGVTPRRAGCGFRFGSILRCTRQLARLRVQQSRGHRAQVGMMAPPREQYPSRRRTVLSIAVEQQAHAPVGRPTLERTTTTGRYRTPCALLFLRPPRRAPEGTPPPRALGSGQAPAPSIIWPLPRRCAKQSRDAWSQLRMNVSMISGFQPLNQSACSEYPAGMRLS